MKWDKLKWKYRYVKHLTEIQKQIVMRAIETWDQKKTEKEDTLIKKMIEHRDNNAEKQFLSRRIAKVWNSLPAGVSDFTNLVCFRTSLEKINLRLFTHF